MTTFQKQTNGTTPYALVSTVRYLLLVNLHTGSVTPIENSRTEYYGITWRPNSEVLILGHSGADNATFVDACSYARSETGWVSEGDINSQEFLSQPHQILCGSDGRVICTNTGRNCISVVDLQRPGYFQELRLSTMRWDRLSLEGEKGEHLNSLFEKDGFLYVLAHAYGKGSFVSVLKYPELSPVETWPRLKISGLHNIWAESGGRVISCHSSAGAIVDVLNEETLWQAGAPVYARGLAACKDYVCVGESEVSGRDLRRSSHSGLWILDRQSWQALDYLSLGPYGAVNEVRLLNIPDEAHHGHVFQGWRALLEKGSLPGKISATRLQAAINHQKTRSIWRGFKDIFGAYTTDEQGRRIALEDCLCLATIGEPSQSGATFSFGVEYEVRESSNSSHASIILGYQGNSSDTNMSAVLVQPHGNTASLSLWFNDGFVWRMEHLISCSNLPLSGELYLASDGKAVTIRVDGKVISRVKANQIIRGEGQHGLRWIGAAVKPLFEMH